MADSSRVTHPLLIFILLIAVVPCGFTKGLLERVGPDRWRGPEDAGIETAGEIDAEAELPQNEAPPPEIAVLLKGPENKKGMPFLPPNAIPIFAAEYHFRDRLFSLYYTLNQFPGAEAWEETACGENMTRIVPVTVGENVVFRQVLPSHNPDYRLFVSYSTDTAAVLTEEEICVFLDAFIRRFRYFFGISSDRTIPPFPAVVPLD